MDELERYLDRVCRSIGGPKALRRHVRQELREHLLDAAAAHRAAGLSEAEALGRALADFGGPEEVRAGLEEAHGQRLMAVVIEKAMQWKERAMRARWLWASWAHLALAGVIGLEVLWLTFANVFLVPRFHRLLRDGMIDAEILREQGMTWMVSVLDGLGYAGDHATWLLLLAAGACVLFEWRVRGENKSLIRLSAWGTAAVALMVPAVLTAGSLVIPYMLGAPATGKIARPFAVQQVAAIDTAVAGLEKALAKEDWGSVRGEADRASEGVGRLVEAGPALGALAPQYGSPDLAELRERLRRAGGCLEEARAAAGEKDAGRVGEAVRRFRELYGPVGKAAGRLSG